MKTDDLDERASTLKQYSMFAAPQHFATEEQFERPILPQNPPQADRWKLADILNYPRKVRTNIQSPELAEGLQVVRITLLQSNCKKLALRVQSPIDREVQETLDYLRKRSVCMDHCCYINKEAFLAHNIDYPEITETDLCVMIQKAQEAFIDWVKRTIPASTRCIETLDLCLLILQQFHDLADAPRDSTTYSIPPQPAKHLVDRVRYNTFVMNVDTFMTNWQLVQKHLSAHSLLQQAIADTFGNLETWDADPLTFYTELEALYARWHANPAEARTVMKQLDDHFQHIIEQHSTPHAMQSATTSDQILSTAKEIQHKLAILASFL